MRGSVSASKAAKAAMKAQREARCTCGGPEFGVHGLRMLDEECLTCGSREYVAANAARIAYEQGRRDALHEAAAVAWNEADRALKAQSGKHPASHGASRCAGGAAAAYVIHDAVRVLASNHEEASERGLI